MPDVCFYAQVHQPYRLARYRLFDVGTDAPWFDDGLNREVLQRVAAKCYVRTNRLLAELVRRSDGRFRFALSLSGTLLEQLEAWAPEALASFQDLVATGGVELLGETSHHSLAALTDPAEFAAQVRLHGRTVERLFGVRPTVFRNTELIYWDGLAPQVAQLGFRGLMVEGADHVLRWRSPNFVYESASTPGLRLLARNYRLSDDVGFRFSRRDWDGWPLTADKYADWIASAPGDVVNLFVDYETFGEHQWEETGVLDFLAHLPEACARRGIGFLHPSEAVERAAVGPLSFPEPTSWADEARDTSAWLGNGLQQAAFERLYRLRAQVIASGDLGLLAAWRRLSTSDHVYYMCTKWLGDGDVHQYFSHWDSPYDAFVAFMNVLEDLEGRLAGLPADRRPEVEDWARLAGMACVA